MTASIHEFNQIIQARGLPYVMVDDERQSKEAEWRHREDFIDSTAVGTSDCSRLQEHRESILANEVSRPVFDSRLPKH
jgi:hypothetical protein